MLRIQLTTHAGQDQRNRQVWWRNVVLLELSSSGTREPSKMVFLDGYVETDTVIELYKRFTTVPVRSQDRLLDLVESTFTSLTYRFEDRLRSIEREEPRFCHSFVLDMYKSSRAREPYLQMYREFVADKSKEQYIQAIRLYNKCIDFPRCLELVLIQA